MKDWIAAHRAEYIGVDGFARLCADMPDIPEATLRKLLRETEVALAPVVEGVRQDTFENLARTLISLQYAYEDGDPATQRHIRSLVITAKNHARLAARAKPEKREMVEWMLVWLENPPVFDSWYRLRAGVSGEIPGNTDTPEDPPSS